MRVITGCSLLNKLVVTDASDRLWSIHQPGRILTRFFHTTVYSSIRDPIVPNISDDPGDDIEIYSDNELQILITRDPNRYLEDAIYKPHALIYMAFHGKLVDPLPPNFDELLLVEIEEIKKGCVDAERDRFGLASLVIRCNIDFEADVPRSLRDDKRILREGKDWLFCDLDHLKIPEIVRKKFDSFCSSPVISLMACLGLEIRLQNKKVGNYFLDTDGKKIYRAPKAMPWKSEWPLRHDSFDHCMKDDYATLMRRLLGDHGLAPALRQFEKSLLENDALMAFLFAWQALEILVNKTYAQTYQQKFDIESAEAWTRLKEQSPAAHEYIDVQSEQRKNRSGNWSPPLVFRFVVFWSCLDAEPMGDAFSEFKKWKQIRDHFLHGEAVDEASLPTEDVQRFFMKMLQCHLQSISSGSH